MKKITQFFIAVFLAINLTYAQGNDIIFLIDNSSSVSATEFDEMSTSIDSIIINVLNCNANNRVAVIHYGTRILNHNIQPNLFPKIWIESDFTNDLATALTYQRQLNNGDYLHESTQLIDNALDGIPNTNIVSPQTQLNTILQNSLVIFIFTDAFRGTNPVTPPVSGGSSYLVNATDPINQPFQVYNNFKINRSTTFFVIHFPPNLQAQQAGAAIASIGGPYGGGNPVENSGPPDFNQTPRYYYLRTPPSPFILSPQEISTISNDLCSLTEDPCDISTVINTITINQPNLEWSIPTGYTGDFFLEFIGSNDCPNGDTGNTTTVIPYTISTNSISLLQVQSNLGRKCFRFRIRTNCSDWSDWCLMGTGPENGALFVQYGDCIPSNPCDNYSNFIDITDDVLSGTTMNYLTYVDIEASNTIQHGATSTFKASNSIILKVGFHAENGANFKAFIDDCQGPIPLPITFSNNSENTPLVGNRSYTEESNSIELFPNPTKGIITIESFDSDIVYWEVLNSNGLKLINSNNQSSKFKKTIIDLKTLPVGLYFIKIKLNDGNSITKKIIKN